MGGWVGARAVMLWPVAPPAVALEKIVAEARATPGVVLASPIDSLAYRDRAVSPIRWHAPLVVMPLAHVHLPLWTGPVRSIAPAARRMPGIVAGLPIVLASPPIAGRSRLFGSFWAVARRGSGPAGGVPGVQLGGSQAGLRLGYALTEDRRLALVGRVSSPLGPGMRELALGVEWQPTHLPVRLVAEQRFALGAGRGGPTLAAVGGVGPVPIALGFRLEAYAQGGVIARDGAEKFADGALRIARPVATLGGVRFDLGAGTWGAAQRGATRLDVGPSLSAVVPIGPQPVRLSLDWRQRVAGTASPGSGLAVTLGADF